MQQTGAEPADDASSAARHACQPPPSPSALGFGAERCCGSHCGSLGYRDSGCAATPRLVLVSSRRGVVVEEVERRRPECKSRCKQSRNQAYIHSSLAFAPSPASTSPRRLSRRHRAHSAGASVRLVDREWVRDPRKVRVPQPRRLCQGPSGQSAHRRGARQRPATAGRVGDGGDSGKRQEDGAGAGAGGDDHHDDA